MPITYKVIAHTSLTSTASSVSFTSIPADYTDLLVKVSARGDGAFLTADRALFMEVNSTNANTIYRRIEGYRNQKSGETSNTALVGTLPGANCTANLFGVTEIYVSNYLSSRNKVSFSYGGATDVASNEFDNYLVSQQKSDTATVTSLVFKSSPQNFVTNSSFTLYGIKNS